MIQEPTDPREVLVKELTRVHDRLTSMSPERLAAQLPTHESRAAAAHGVARRCALLAQGVEARAGDPMYRELPEVEDRIVADQLAVCVTDLLIATEGLAASEQVWVGMTRQSVGDVLAEAVTAIQELRRSL